MKNSAAEADDLRWFCNNLLELREQARQDGWSTELLGMLAELRAGTLPATTALERVCDRLGLPVRLRGYTPVPGQDPTVPPSGAYTCPSGRCSRVERREPGGLLPECAVFDEPLTLG
ncbi:hypothetical protein [Streptomyces sp. NPDC006368]|uniref:hypothetical protein n=1 Tax=Streptomyces sp. NPDC006368 TaxID=3156760 RepID=UPI0033B8226B